MIHEYIKTKMFLLTKRLNKYSLDYNNLKKLKITHYKYDLLLNKLKLLEKKYPEYQLSNSPNKQIYYKYNKKTLLIKHNIPMLSINSIYSYKQLKKFFENIKKKFLNINYIYCCELKIDGIAISIIYKNKKIFQSMTRGNGKYGEDILSHIKFIPCIPHTLKTNINNTYIEIRGELFINKKKFHILNKYNYSRGKKIFSNTRNMVSGTIKKKKINKLINNQLSFIAYDLIIDQKNRLSIETNHYLLLKQIKNLNFKTDNNTIICKTYNEIKQFYKFIKKQRPFLPYNIDGLVIKINDRITQENIKYNNKYIKWAIAWKFKSYSAWTKLVNIKYQISKQGIINPIAIVNTVHINGVNINKINLHNLNYLKKLSLSINDKILVKRSGDVIPVITKIIKINNHNYINIPNICPSCQNKLDFTYSSPRCTNISICPEQKIHYIHHFISKNGLNIQGIGLKITKKLIKYKIIKNIIDLLQLTKQKLLLVPHFKEKLSNKIITSIQYAIQHTQLYNIIYALSIPSIGINTSYIIAKKYIKMKYFINDRKNNFDQIKKIGPTKISIIKKFLYNKNNFLLLKKLFFILNI